MEKSLPPGAAKTKVRVFCVAALILYAYGALSARAIPMHIEGIALPLDFMVGIPLGFYLLVVRPRRLTPLTVIPVIWVGHGISALALGSPDAGILPLLLAGLVPVELAIAARECVKIAKVFRSAKATSPDPMAWFRDTMRYLVGQEAAANITSAELGVWYYALLSWRQKPYTLPGEKAFSYHNAGGYMNMMLGLGLAFPVEIVAVHLLLVQWSMMAAVAATALSLYAAIWLIGDARARIMRPIAVGPAAVRLECGIQMEATISLSDIERIAFSDGNLEGIPESDRLNYGTFYHPDAWVVLKQPAEVRTLIRAKRVRAVGISVDDPKAFATHIAEALVLLPHEPPPSSEHPSTLRSSESTSG